MWVEGAALDDEGSIPVTVVTCWGPVAALWRSRGLRFVAARSAGDAAGSPWPPWGQGSLCRSTARLC